MTPAELAAIRERADHPILGKSMAVVLDQAVLDQRALLDHIDTLAAEVKRVEAQRKDCFTFNASLEHRLAAVRELANRWASTGDPATKERKAALKGAARRLRAVLDGG